MKTCRAEALAIAVAILAALSAGGALFAQQADADPNPAAKSPAAHAPANPSLARQGQEVPLSAQRDSNAAPVHDPQTQDALAFTGRVEREKGQIVLNDPVTKVSYYFDNQLRAKQFLGRHVKVTGKLELSSNKIHIESIEAIP